MVEREIYITRGMNSFLQARGLQGVLIWMHEPSLELNPRIDVCDYLDTKEYKELKELIYGENVMYGFVYRRKNDINSGFGDKLIRNFDGIDIQEKLIEYYDNRMVQFYHSVYGGGRKSGYRPVNVGDLFGYESEQALKIWKMICDEFGDIPYTEWDKHEKDIPWYRFCKKLTMKIDIDV